MNNFYYNNPTKVYFGRNMIKSLASIVSDYNSILVVFGRNSAKSNGLFDELIAQLQGKHVHCLCNISPNPTLDKIYEGIQLCRDNNIDLVIGAGGGSVSDSAKLIAAGAMLQPCEDVWGELFVKKRNLSRSIATGIIITVPGSGSEMSNSVVVTNSKTNEKRNAGASALFPDFCIIDPEYTYTLSKEQMAFGCVDTFVHLCETYFSEPYENNVTDYLIEATLRCLTDNIGEYLSKPDDYNARSNIMWCSTMAMNGILKCCKKGDWFSHALEHEVSGEYPYISHGEGLSVIYPHYLRVLNNRGYSKLVNFAENVYGLKRENISEAIDRVETLFRAVGCKSKLPEIDVDIIMRRMEKIISFFPDFDMEDVNNILLKCVG